MKFKPVKQINWMEVSGLLVGVFFTVAIMVFALVLYTKLFTSGMIGVEEYHLHSTFDPPPHSSRHTVTSNAPSPTEISA